MIVNGINDVKQSEGDDEYQPGRSAKVFKYSKSDQLQKYHGTST